MHIRIATELDAPQLTLARRIQRASEFPLYQTHRDASAKRDPRSPCREDKWRRNHVGRDAYFQPTIVWLLERIRPQ